MANDNQFPEMTRELNTRKAEAAPEIIENWRKFAGSVFKEGALSVKTKELIAVASAHITQCPYCIRVHVQKALKLGITEEEIMEAVWVATEMRAGAAYAHANIAMDEIMKQSKQDPDDGAPKA